MKEWREMFASKVAFITDLKQYFALLCFVFLHKEFVVSFEHSDVATMEGEGGDPLSVNKNPRICKGNF